jgi:hypothetical protein
MRWKLTIFAAGRLLSAVGCANREVHAVLPARKRLDPKPYRA